MNALKKDNSVSSGAEEIVISVLDNNTKTIDILDLPQNDRLLLLSNIYDNNITTQSQNPSNLLPVTFVNTFSELFDKVIYLKTNDNVPTIDEILIRKIVEFSNAIGRFVSNDRRNQVVFPVISDKGIKIQMETTLCVTEKLDFQMVYKDSIVHVVGFKYNDICFVDTDKLNVLECMLSCDNKIFVDFANQGIITDYNSLYIWLSNVLFSLATNLFSNYVMGVMTKRLEYKIDRPQLVSTKYVDVSDEFLVVIENLMKMKFKTEFDNGLYMDLVNNNLYDVYMMYKINGMNDKFVVKYLDQIKEINNFMNYQTTMYKKRMSELNTINTYISIIKDKLSHKKYEAVKASENKINTMSLVDYVKYILGLLTVDEKKIVNLEYERLTKFRQSMINNKCPHIPLLRKLNKVDTVRSSEKIRLLNELLKFKKNPVKPGSMIVCNNCGFDLICPHQVDYYNNYLSSGFNIRKALNKYLDYLPSQLIYYCRICSEAIIDKDLLNDDVKTEMSNDIRDDIKDAIYKEGFSIFKLLKLPPTSDFTVFMENAMLSLYPYIDAIDQQLNKSRVYSVDFKMNKFLYMIGIYAMAYNVKYILTSTHQVSFHDLHNVKDVTKLLQYAIGRFNEMKYVLINKLQNISTDIIINDFKKAYKEISGLNLREEQSVKHVDVLYDNILKDPIYNCFFRLCLSNEPKLISNVVPKFANIIQSDVYNDRQFASMENILGFNKANVSKTKYTYENIRPRIKKQNLTIDKLTWKTMPNYKNIIKKYNDNYNDYRLLSIYPLQYILGVSKINPSDDDDFYKSYKKLLDDTNASYDIFNMYKTVLSVKPIYDIPHDSDMRFSYINMTLGFLYDELGRLHDWNIMVDESGEEINLKKINDDLKSGVVHNIVNYKCSVCGEFKDKTSKLSNSKIITNLTLNQDIGNLFTYYEFKCPSDSESFDNIHSFDNDKCVKCGLIKEIRNNVLNNKLHKDNNIDPDVLQYYNKYLSKFKKSSSEVFHNDLNIMDTAVVAVDKLTNKFDDSSDMKSWLFDFSIIIDVCQKLELNEKLFMAIGSTQGVPYEDVKSGSYVPMVPRENMSTRAYFLKNVIYSLISKYNTMRNYNNFINLPYWLDKLSKSIEFPASNGKLLEDLPSIYENFEENFTYFINNKQPDKIILWLQQTLAQKLLKILSFDEKKTYNIRFAFAKMFMTDVIDDDSIAAKYDKTKINFNVFNVSISKIMKKDYDDNFDETAGDTVKMDDDDLEENPDIEKDVKANDYGDTNEPFDNDAYDIDIEHDDDEGEFGDNMAAATEY